MEAFDRGLRWKELREKLGLSQQEVADRLGVTRSTISAYEGNLKSPRLDILEELAILYRSSVDYMLGMEKRPRLFIDDLTDSQQQTILTIVDTLRQEFKKNNI